jgi:uncharacterized tellurite resistance protein B-like protein
VDKITHTEQYMNLMAYIVRADGIIDDDERSQLLDLLQQRLQQPLDEAATQALQAKLDAAGPSQASDQELLEAGAGIDTHTLCLLVRDAYALAASDGEIHATEIKTMRRYLRLIGIPIERFADIDMWARASTLQLQLGETLLTPLSAQTH